MQSTAVPWISFTVGISLGSVIAISWTSFRRIAMGNWWISVTDVENILATVYGITDPRGHPTRTRLAEALPEPSDLVPLR